MRYYDLDDLKVARQVKCMNSGCLAMDIQDLLWRWESVIRRRDPIQKEPRQVWLMLFFCFLDIDKILLLTDPLINQQQQSTMTKEPVKFQTDWLKTV